MSKDNLEEIIQAILNSSKESIESLEKKFVNEVLEAAEFIQNQNPVSIILLGSGKSGYIASRLAATLRSLGFNAFFLHSGELLHGDLGAVNSSSLLIIFSNSGKTVELVKTAEIAKGNGVPIVSFIGQPNSLIGGFSDRVIDLSGSVKNDYLRFIPTATLITASVAGDCLMAVLSQLYSRGITEFLDYHPEGSLGQFLNTSVSQLMKPVNQVAMFQPWNTLQEVAIKLTEFPNGIGVAVTEKLQVIGIVTDGDIRRLISENLQTSPRELVMEHFINGKPTLIEAESTIAHALNIMTSNLPKRISALPVIQNDILVGVITMADIEQRREKNA